MNHIDCQSVWSMRIGNPLRFIRIDNPYKFKKKFNVFFYINLVIFINICINIITLNSLFKCIKYENLNIYHYIYAYQFQCNILVYVVKK